MEVWEKSEAGELEKDDVSVGGREMEADAADDIYLWRKILCCFSKRII